MIIISGGHQPNGGAYGIISETTENRKIVQEIKRLDNSVKDVTINYNTDWQSELRDKVNMVNSLCNSNKVDCYADIHFNASNGQGTGVECFVLGYNSGLYSSKESYDQNYAKAKKVCDSIAKALGIPNRGVKLDNDFYVLRNPNCHSMIIEVCFLDNRNDMNKYNTAIVSKAILEGLKGKVVESPVYKEGWQLDGVGWWYQYSNGTYIKSNWMLKENFWYYFDANGYAVTGWKFMNGADYFFDKDCKMVTNSFTATSYGKYYLGADGKMLKGWIKVDNKTYFMDYEKGVMHLDKIKDGFRLSKTGEVFF